MPRLFRFVLALVSLVAFGIANAEQVTVDRDSNLMAEPRGDATVVTKLTKGTKVETVGKQSGWLNVKTAKEAGWIPSFNVRFGAEASGGGADAGAAVGRVFTGQKPAVVSVIGLRGIDLEDLKQAKFDPQQLALLDSYTVPREQAEQTAAAAGLVSLKLDYLLK